MYWRDWRSHAVIGFAYLGDEVSRSAWRRHWRVGIWFRRRGRTDTGKIPQLGRVVVQDGVEIGANSTSTGRRWAIPLSVKEQKLIIWCRLVTTPGSDAIA